MLNLMWPYELGWGIMRCFRMLLCWSFLIRFGIVLPIFFAGVLDGGIAY